MTKRHYQGSLLAQKILLNKKIERLRLIRLLAIGFGGFVLFHFMALVVLTIYFEFLSCLNHYFPIMTDSFASFLLRAILTLWGDKGPFQINVAMALMGICCFFLAIWMDIKLEHLQEIGEDN